MSGEFAKAVGETAKSMSEVAKTQKFDNVNSFDPDKKAEVSHNDAGKKSDANDFNPDKKAEIREENGEKYFFDKDTFCRVDDNETVYSKNGELLPNNTYELNGYKYTTDEKRRIISVTGKLQLPETKPRQPLPEIPDRKDTDDRGHLIAHEFGGDDTEGNLVPMDSDVNRNGEYRKLERELKKFKEEGHDVNVTIEIQYEGDSKRPTEFVISYDVDDEHYEKVIKNESSKGE